MKNTSPTTPTRTARCRLARKATLALAVCALFPHANFADWQQIDDFEYADSSGLWDNWFLAGIQAELNIAEVIEDPVSSSNRVLWFDTNTYETVWTGVHAIAPKEKTPVPDGGEVTLYWRWFWSGASHASAMGFAVAPNDWIEPGQEGNTTNRPMTQDAQSWPDYRTVVHSNIYDNDPNTSLYIYDNNGYRQAMVDADTPFDMPIGSWVECWMHVRNAVGATGADEYEIYMRPLNSDIVHLKVPSASDPSQLFDTALFRGQVDGELPRFRYVSYPGLPATRFAGDRTLIDDVYIDYSGLNLETPPGVEIVNGEVTYWAGLQISGTGVEASVESPTLGTLLVHWQPWIRSKSLKSWLYFVEESASNTWIYVAGGNDNTGEGDVWNGLPVLTGSANDRWVVSDSLGMLYIDSAPWVWSDALKTWIYLPEYHSTGSWFFVF